MPGEPSLNIYAHTGRKAARQQVGFKLCRYGLLPTLMSGIDRASRRPPGDMALLLDQHSMKHILTGQAGCCCLHAA